ncbi:MAG TPA: xanthine dehydrogenase family protein subunit M [Bryobacteraceae bacterium]|jgi:xanthine dehydrogenase YagS FAD-binding subunit|nr:xanthine dehydrogenase family protein subunit M [Bryobacteraceae bacterium]
MKTFSNANPKDVREAIALLGQARQQGRSASIVGGGSDLLGMVKERLVSPDMLVNLKAIRGLDRVEMQSGKLRIGGLITLDTLSHDAQIRKQYAVLAEAAESVGTPQIRNAGTLAGNVCQRPWCWYYRNGFPCLKNGGDKCFSASGENQLHAIFGGGPSYIVHPSDTAPALVALDAEFHVSGPKGDRVIPAGQFFQLPRVDASRENVLAPDDVLVAITLPAARPGARSMYHKVLDREAWTHAVVSAAIVLDMDKRVCRSARIVLGGVAPIPWRLPKVEAMLAGQRITPELAAKAGEAAVEGARPLAKNKYKVPLTSAVVKRTLLSLATAT